MDYAPEGLRFLHIAYAVIVAAQVAYGLWLVRQWRRAKKPGVDSSGG